jgi:hypothetical protein
LDDPQAGYLLLKWCFSPKIDHLLSSVASDDIVFAARRHDRRILESLASLTLGRGERRTDAWKRAVAQARLPAKEGGLGLSSAEALREVCLLSAWFRCAPAMVARLPQLSDRIFKADWGVADSNATPLGNALRKAWLHLRVHLPDGLRQLALPRHGLLASVASGEGPSASIQGFFTSKIHEVGAAELRRELPAGSAARARLFSASSGVTSCLGVSALTALPTFGACRLSPEEARFQLRHRLGLPVTPHSFKEFASAVCACGLPLAGLDDNHFLTCSSTKGFVSHRHNSTERDMLKMCARAGAAAVLEPRADNGETMQRCDLWVDLGANNEWLVDLTIRHPGAASHLKRGSGDYRGACAFQAEAAKRGKYISGARGQGMDFSAFAIETWGTMGREADSFMKRLAKHCGVVRGGGSRKAQALRAARFMTVWRNRLGMRLVKENQRVLRRYIRRVYAANGHIWAAQVYEAGRLYDMPETVPVAAGAQQAVGRQGEGGEAA